MVDMRRADLHAHSIYSDGLLAPAALVKLIRDHGVSGLAITDHDTIDGLREAIEAGEHLGVEIMPGVELSVSLHGEGIHLLGYGFDVQDAALRAHFEECRERRRSRAHRILEQLAILGVPVNVDAILQQYMPGRLHIAQALVESGHVENTREAFDRFLARGRPAYMAGAAISAAEAIGLIQAAGGLSVLAHPGHHTSHDMLQSLIRAGLDGLETIHPSHDEALTAYYRQIASELKLLETGGSDFHSMEHIERLGRYSAPWSWLAEIQRARTLKIRQ